MNAHLLMPAEIAFKHVQQRQGDLAREFATGNRSEASRTRFIRMFHLRRMLFRFMPRVAAHI